MTCGMCPAAMAPGRKPIRGRDRLGSPIGSGGLLFATGSHARARCAAYLTDAPGRTGSGPRGIRSRASRRLRREHRYLSHNAALSTLLGHSAAQHRQVGCLCTLWRFGGTVQAVGVPWAAFLVSFRLHADWARDAESEGARLHTFLSMGSESLQTEQSRGGPAKWLWSRLRTLTNREDGGGYSRYADAPIIWMEIACALRRQMRDGAATLLSSRAVCIHSWRQGVVVNRLRQSVVLLRWLSLSA